MQPVENVSHLLGLLVLTGSQEVSLCCSVCLKLPGHPPVSTPKVAGTRKIGHCLQILKIWKWISSQAGGKQRHDPSRCWTMRAGHGCLEVSRLNNGAWCTATLPATLVQRSVSWRSTVTFPNRIRGAELYWEPRSLCGCSVGSRLWVP